MAKSLNGDQACKFSDALGSNDISLQTVIGRSSNSHTALC